ncbi:hypothetical protein BDB00DRAFT_787984 [Zychaea mexicana]|uniref:uncharacterized protein n=1 Tax=Zychaea mexicana TaxID=64656 RepID=UPI0022FDB736|nr:uncharacterized protein BDB00DRAFT_787984 [Zychaea mexicana]KAI9493500.1 hypothetical protein BDB00DRAFT_787984 [Zychaea mexicana]
MDPGTLDPIHNSTIADELVQAMQPDTTELTSQLIALLSVTVMCVLFGVKTYNVDFKYLTYSRWLVICLYINSWGFTYSAILLASTNNGNNMSCLLSELTCDVFYAGTKLTIYFWLIEKVWVVSAVRKARMKTWSYKFHLLLMTPFIFTFSLMLIFHIAELKDDGTCMIGLQPIASIPLLVYDFIFNMYMTILFVKPLVQSGKSISTDWKSTRLHDVARRTLVASVVCLLISFANILVLTIMNGRERGVVCLTCCTIDVTINVVTVHWVTSNPASKKAKDHINSTSNPNDTMQATFSVDHKEKNGYGVGMEHNPSNAFVMVTPNEDDHGSQSTAPDSSLHKSF